MQFTQLRAIQLENASNRKLEACAKLLSGAVERYQLNRMLAVWQFIATLVATSAEDPKVYNEYKNSPTLRIIMTGGKSNPALQSLVNLLVRRELIKVITSEEYLTDVPTSFQKQANLTTNKGLEIPRVENLRFSAFEEYAFIILDIIGSQTELCSVVRINQSFNRFQIRALLRFPFNLNPQRVRHVFIGRQENTMASLTCESVKVLKYKMGLVVSDRIVQHAVVELPDSSFSQPRYHNVAISKKINDCETTFDRFAVLRNRHMVVQSYPIRLQIIRDASGKVVGGIAYSLVQTLADHFNFTFEYHVDGWQNVGQMPNGSWHGFIGSVMDHRADLILWLGPTYGRHPYLDVTVPIVNLETGIITPWPRAEVQWEAMFYTFTPKVWVCIGLTCICIVPIFYGYFVLQNWKRVRPVDSPLYQAIMVPFAALLSMDTLMPRFGQLLTCIFLFYCLILRQYLDSVLVSYITLPELEKMPESWEDLARMTNYRIEFVRYVGSFSDVFFQESNDTSVRSIAKRMNNIGPGRPVAKALLRTALDRDTVVVDYVLGSYGDISQNLTLYPGVHPVKIKPIIVGVYVCIGLRKYSMYTDEMSQGVGMLQSTGHMQKWKHDVMKLARLSGKAWLHQLKKQGSSYFKKLKDATDVVFDAGVKPFKPEHFILCFWSWIFGISMGAVSFGWECEFLGRIIMKYRKTRFYLP